MKQSLQSSIQWTDFTLNFWMGCIKVDQDCKFCYMYRDFERLGRDAKIISPVSIKTINKKLKEANSLASQRIIDGDPTPVRIFVSSWTDFFIKEADEFRAAAWEIIRNNPNIVFQLLTKRPERILECLPEYWDEIKHHVWLGTSVGSKEGIPRAQELIKCRPIAPTLFLSLEPMHEELNFRWTYWSDKPRTNEHELLLNMDWVIVGGESGNDNGKYRYRECKIIWIEQVVQHCKEAGTPVFVKQLGTYLAKEMNLKDRHGGDIDEWPDNLKIRQFPKV